MMECILDPDSPEGKSKEFVDKNYMILRRLYPGKWVVVLDCKVLFAADTSDEMFERAESLGMVRGHYYYRHVSPAEQTVKFPSPLGL